MHIYLILNMKQKNEEVLKILDNLRRIILDKGITQAAMASYLDKDASQFSKILNGSMHLRLEHLSKIATGLGMSIIDIITYPEKYVPSEKKDELVKTSVTIELDGEKREKVLKMIFEVDNLEFLK